MTDPNISSGMPEMVRNLEVEALLRSTIMERGPITFAEFMEVSLYSEHGYYASGIVEIGAQGGEADFMTSPEAHPVFGATMANVLNRMWTAMDRPADFDAAELGPGNGTLGHDIMAKLGRSFPELLARTRFIFQERSPSLIARQQERLAQLTLPVAPPLWVPGSAADFPLDNINGVIFSNELLDVMPTHRLINRNGTVYEIYITMDNEGAFVETLGPVSEAVANLVPPIEVPEGHEVTVSPMQDKLQRRLAAALNRGYIVTVDYGIGDPRRDAATYEPRVYSGRFRQRTGHPIQHAYERPGATDMTTSVDFERQQRIGASVGLQTLLYTDQASFLCEHGFDAELAEMIEMTAPKGIDPSTHYFASHALVDGEYMGGFRVLVQGKNVPALL